MRNILLTKSLVRKRLSRKVRITKSQLEKLSQILKASFLIQKIFWETLFCNSDDFFVKLKVSTQKQRDINTYTVFSLFKHLKQQAQFERIRLFAKSKFDSQGNTHVLTHFGCYSSTGTLVLVHK
jgi:hypothetical protein